jgi:hypothetical protein
MLLGIRTRVHTRDARNDTPSRDGDVLARKLPNDFAISKRTFSTTQPPVDL